MHSFCKTLNGFGKLVSGSFGIRGVFLCFHVLGVVTCCHTAAVDFFLKDDFSKKRLFWRSISEQKKIIPILKQNVVDIFLNTQRIMDYDIISCLKPMSFLGLCLFNIYTQISDFRIMFRLIFGWFLGCKFQKTYPLYRSK